MKLRVEIVIFTFRDSALQVLLTKRAKAPFQGRMSLPGRGVGEGESLEDAARRELAARAGARKPYLKQLYSFGNPRRDPRGRVISVAYCALIPGCGRSRAGREVLGGEWRRADRLPPLAFDHRKIVSCALHRLRGKLDRTTAGFQLLPKKFTLPELQAAHESILQKKLDKRNFRKKMELLGVVKPLPEWRRTGRKPARLYTFLPGRG